MASRLRPPGIAKPGNSKLARPGLRSPGGLKKPNSQPSPLAKKLAAGQVQQQVKQVRPQPIKPVNPAEGGGTASGEQPLEVGDRVLFNGKYGLIAFLGPVQFANGNWAGIVLDSIEGKNNGSVNGVQYFECEPNRGLFAKQEKIKFVSKGNQPTLNQPAATNEPQFRVGELVLMDGQREGTIGFIGTTQFARGVWAGMILDTPEGKNDGTVSGVRYFECPPNHGLFTRPQKLRHIKNSAISNNLPPPSPPASRTPQDEGQRSASLTPVDLKALHDKLTIGDHVLVGGIKEGILRFLGPTEFAKGIWVGVELPEPMGKNDGAISGKRYFQCEAKHGLFAPLPKVEKLATAGSEGVPSLSASSPASSPFHSPKIGAAQQGGMREPLRDRHPSGSSVNSYGSCRPMQDTLLADSPLQDTAAADLAFLLQEKDEEIETLQATLDQREKEKLTHQEELTELRRQVDDLQFQLEEQGVISGDQMETATETSTQQVSNLSRALQQERKLTQQLRDQLKSNEGCATDDMKTGLIDVQIELEERTQEVSTHLANISRLKEELQQAKEAAETNSAPSPSPSSPSSSSLNQELSQTKLNLDSERSHVTLLEQELAQTRTDLEAELKRCASLQQDQGAAEEVSYRSSSLEAELVQMELAVQNLQGEVSGANRGLQEAMDLCTQHETLIEERNVELSDLEDKIRQLTKDQELWSGERSRLQSEQDRLIGERDKAIAECDNLMTQTTNTSIEQNELSQQRREFLAERETLLAQQQAMHTEHEKLASERDELLHQLKELQDQKQDVLEVSQQMNMQYSTAQGELVQAKSELKLVALELSVSKEAWEQDKLNLREQVELARVGAAELEHRVSGAAIERDATLLEAQDLADKLEKTQTERDSLKLALENAQVQVDELQFQLDELNTRFLSLEQESTSEVLDAEHRLEAAEVLLAERERDLASAQEKLSSLSEDLIASQGKLDMGLLEEEKQLLEERVKELIIQLEKSQQREKRDSKVFLEKLVTNDSENMSVRLEEAQIQLLESQTQQDNLLQEIEDYKQQTEFLNSVITDLQNKLEGVEAMKGLHGAMESVSDYVADDDDDDEEDPMLDNLPPPRLFCDICDIFDEHDTDDCPMQTTSSDSPPHSKNHGNKAPGGSDRPYCDNCEIFGHWTGDCEYEVTY